MSVPSNAPVVTLQGNVLSVQLRLTGTGSYKTLVCETDANIQNTAPNSLTQTNCGPLLAWGQPSFSVTANCVFNSNSDPSDELSLNQAQQWFLPVPQMLDVLIEYPQSGSAGATYYRQGQCVITSLNETFATNELLKFTITLTGNLVLTATGS